MSTEYCREIEKRKSAIAEKLFRSGAAMFTFLRRENEQRDISATQTTDSRFAEATGKTMSQNRLRNGSGEQ